MGWLVIALIVIAGLTSQYFEQQQRLQEHNQAEAAAKHFAQYTQAAASRMFEMGSNFITEPGYALGAPPAAGALWLLSPADCARAGIPALPSTESGQPVSRSFLPCDFIDETPFGQTYTTSWTLVYPGTRMTIQSPFLYEGFQRDDLGGQVAASAKAESAAGFGDSTMDVFLDYNYDPATGTLTATVDRTGPFAADPHIRRDGTTPFDETAVISWSGPGNKSIAPNGDQLDINADGGINLKNNVVINGNLEVTGIITTRDVIISSVLVEGVFPARVSRMPFTSQIVKSGDLVPQDTCLAALAGDPVPVAQVNLDLHETPTGDGMLIETTTGTISGDVLKTRVGADPVGNQWQLWVEVFVRQTNSWHRLTADGGEIRAETKCT